jgi:hypothetical protein
MQPGDNTPKDELGQARLLEGGPTKQPNFAGLSGI